MLDKKIRFLYLEPDLYYLGSELQPFTRADRKHRKASDNFWVKISRFLRHLLTDFSAGSDLLNPGGIKDKQIRCP